MSAQRRVGCSDALINAFGTLGVTIERSDALVSVDSLLRSRN
jgi:hypothetical protein